MLNKNITKYAALAIILIAVFLIFFMQNMPKINQNTSQENSIRKEGLNHEFIISLEETVVVEDLEITFNLNNAPVVDKAYNINRKPGVGLLFRLKNNPEAIGVNFYQENGLITEYGYNIHILERIENDKKLKLKVTK